MVQKLPTHGFKWKEREDLKKKIDELAKKGKEGYRLKVNVKYPKGLQENHNEPPFLTEKMKIGRVEKLVPKDKK